MKINYLDIGIRMCAIRNNKNITQEQLAEITNVGPTHISHIETGRTIPSLKLFIQIVNALGVSADELLCDNLEKSKNIYENEITLEVKDCTEKNPHNF